MDERIDKLEERERKCELDVAENGEGIKNLKEGLDRHCKSIKKTQEDLNAFKLYIDDKIDKITDSLSKRLPLWATALITILTSLSVGLIVFSIK